ncbi:hypothetical protein DSO57_1001118 [Entomophthora muscae]|uniref:Uncharacterized protein n=1 Tax=Entomophthora muscae TaxID=34485 RepID=A0ACC2SBD5_9FUNG|nr:hypothetical protein DSO57_1001118 [Entomophthora muscae]
MTAYPIPDLSPPIASQYTGIAYITLAGLRHHGTLHQILGFASLLWRALPSSQQRKLAAKANRTRTGMWYPDANHSPIFLIISVMVELL